MAKYYIPKKNIQLYTFIMDFAADVPNPALNL